MADYSQLVAKPRDVQILRPDGSDEPTGIIVTIRPRDSKEVKAVERAAEAALLKGTKQTPADLEERRIDLLVAHLAGWDWGVDPVDGSPNEFEGSAPAFNELNVRKVFKALPWFRRQIDREAAKDADFFEKRSAPSATP